MGVKRRVFWEKLTTGARKHALRRCADGFGHEALASDLRVDRSVVSKWANPAMLEEVPSLDVCLAAADITGDLWVLGRMNAALGTDERIAHLEKRAAMHRAVEGGHFDADDAADRVLSRIDAEGEA